MTHVVTSACFGCKYTDCVEDCPVDCFREREQMLYIDPEQCIDCRLCVSLCPVDAIFADDDVPEADREFIDLNAQMARTCPPIIEKKPRIVKH